MIGWSNTCEVAMSLRHSGTPKELRKEVLQTIKRRARAGQALNSGANRGDWLYAAAVRFFGSWGNAVEAAGFRYASVKRAALDRDELLVRIRSAAAEGPLNASKHPLLR